jgi:ankyrin repeat protein
MTKFAKRQTQHTQISLLFHSLELLIRSSNSEMLLWPNSPLLVLLQIVDTSALSGDEPLQEGENTKLHFLAKLAAPSDYSTHEKQLILEKELIEHGANVNFASSPQGETPLHIACSSGVVTNLDFVEYLLEVGADPNVQDHLGKTPLMHTTLHSPGAANFLLNWPTTDANITTRSGASFLPAVRETAELFSDIVAFPDNPEKVQHQFLLEQWRKIEEMLVKRRAVDAGITTLE